MSPEILTLYYNHSIIDITITTIIFFSSILLTVYTRGILKLNKLHTLLIFSIHMFMFPLYMIYLLKYGTDSLTYFVYFDGYNFLEFESGQIFLNKLIIFFDFFKLNFYNINYLISILSLFSFFLYLKIIENLKIKDKFTFYIVLSFFCLPSIHFWHMGFSKDTLTFFCISIIVYEVMKFKPNLFIIILSLSLLYFVRAHISLMTFTALIFFYLINNQNKFFKILIIILFLFITPILLKTIFNFTDLNSIVVFLEMFDDLYTSNYATALYSDTNIFLKAFYYIFLPNIFFIKDMNLFYLFVVFENTLLVILFLKVITFKILSLKNLKRYSFLILFSLIALFLLSYVTSNLGIATRQKWIFLPVIFIMLSAAKYNYNYK